MSGAAHRVGAPSTRAGDSPGRGGEPVPAAAATTLHAKYERQASRVLLSGVEALVRLTLEQRWLDHRRDLRTAAFVSGYEGSPLGGLNIEFHRARRDLSAWDVVFKDAVNEELAATAVAGTQLLGELPGRRVDGVTGYWFGKNPGLDRAADAIRHGNFSGTAPLGGAVAVIGDDPTCKSSTIPSSCEAMARSLSVPLLAPSTVAGILQLGLQAVALSRHAGVWVGLKIVADLADGSATVDLDPDADDHLVPPPDRHRPFTPPLLLGPAALAAEADLFERRIPLVREFGRENGLNAVRLNTEHPRTVIVASGMAYAALALALRDLGVTGEVHHRLGLRTVELAMPWPLDAAHLRQLCGGAQTVLVVEDKAPFVEAQLKEALYGMASAPAVIGKEDGSGAPLVPRHGAVDADLVAAVLGSVLDPGEIPLQGRRYLERLARPEPVTAGALAGAPKAGAPGSVEAGEAPADLPARTPYFCSGCPHNISTRAPDDALVGLGIGCHIMASFDEHGRGHHVGSTQMGGEGAQWTGLAPFTDDRHFFQNLGDGTFFHSGSLAVRAAVAAGVDITYKILYNRAVAMTGGQAPEGGMDVAGLTHWLALEGVTRMVVTTPDPGQYRRRGERLDPKAEVRHRDELDAVQAELADTPGVTALIYDDRCAAEKRRLRKRGALPTPAERVWINERVCEGCGDCAGKSTCLSVTPVDTEYGPKTRIHQGSCNLDFSCLRGDCPSFVLVTPRPERRRRGAARHHRATGPPAIPAGAGAAVASSTRRPEPPELPPDPRLKVPGTGTVVRMAGIGGSGVVTVSRILQMAARLCGRHAAGVDQTGLAQKGGPVISDVRFTERPADGQVRAGKGAADVLLGFDLLGAASPGNLAVADPARTVAVVSIAHVPTKAMVTGAATFPRTHLVTERIERATRSGENAYLDAQAVAEHLVGEPMSANMVLVGAAYQHGCLPLPAVAIERAIELNGAAVDANRAAFRWGRAAVADPDGLRRALGLAGVTPPPDTATVAAVPVTFSGTGRAALSTDLAREMEIRFGRLALSSRARSLVEHRAAELEAYQNTGYGRRFVGHVAAVAAAEADRTGDPQWPVTVAFARNLFTLMAYKDEYEVARLHLLAAERARLEEEFGPDARTTVMLHPPVLRALGLEHKIGLRRTAGPAFRALRAARRLRGTPFDPFGHTRVRHTERRLVAEYVSLVTDALQHLRLPTAGAVVELASLPEVIRGYEERKLAGVERFRARAEELSTAIARSGRPGDAEGGGGPSPQGHPGRDLPIAG